MTWIVAFLLGVTDGQLFKNFCCFFYRMFVIMYTRINYWAVFCCQMRISPTSVCLFVGLFPWYYLTKAQFWFVTYFMSYPSFLFHFVPLTISDWRVQFMKIIITRSFAPKYEGDSKSKGKIHLTAVIQVTVSNFTYYFST